MRELQTARNSLICAYGHAYIYAMKSARIHIRLTSGEKTLIEESAVREERSVSEFIRIAAIEKAAAKDKKPKPAKPRKDQ